MRELCMLQRAPTRRGRDAASHALPESPTFPVVGVSGVLHRWPIYFLTFHPVLVLLIPAAISTSLLAKRLRAVDCPEISTSSTVQRPHLFTDAGEDTGGAADDRDGSAMVEALICFTGILGLADVGLYIAYFVSRNNILLIASLSCTLLTLLMVLALKSIAKSQRDKDRVDAVARRAIARAGA